MDAFFSLGHCLAVTLMLAVAEFTRREIRRQKAAAFPYLSFYWVASTFFAMFLAFALEDPRFAGNLGRCSGYLLFSSAMLITGLWLQHSRKGRLAAASDTHGYSRKDRAHAR